MTSSIWRTYSKHKSIFQSVYPHICLQDRSAFLNIRPNPHASPSPFDISQDIAGITNLGKILLQMPLCRHTFRPWQRSDSPSNLESHHSRLQVPWEVVTTVRPENIFNRLYCYTPRNNLPDLQISTCISIGSTRRLRILLFRGCSGYVYVGTAWSTMEPAKITWTNSITLWGVIIPHGGQDHLMA